MKEEMKDTTRCTALSYLSSFDLQGGRSTMDAIGEISRQC